MYLVQTKTDRKQVPCSLSSIPQLINLFSRSHCSDYLDCWKTGKKSCWLRPWRQYKLDWNVIRDSATLTEEGWLMPDGYKQKGKPHCLLETGSEKKFTERMSPVLGPYITATWEGRLTSRLFHGRLYSFLALRTVFALTERSINKCAITGWMNDAFTICSKPFSIIICKTVYFLTHISHIYLELLFASTPRMKQWGSSEISQGRRIQGIRRVCHNSHLKSQKIPNEISLL